MNLLKNHVRFRTTSLTKCILLTVYCLIVTISAGLIIQPVSFSQSSQPGIPKYVGGENCVSCHNQQYNLWKDSHHAWALQKPQAETMLGDFNNRKVTHRDIDWEFYKRGDRYFVKTIGPDNKPGEFEIKYAVGKEPLQQYLVELPGGRLQALDMAWDKENRKWFHLYPEQILTPDDGLHWTGPYKNWNGRCAVCHSTDYKKNYDNKKQEFRSEWTSINVSCEACHGPGEAHVAWANNKSKDTVGKNANVNPMGLVGDQTKTQKSELNLCAGCHSRRNAMDADSPLPGSDFHDHYRLALLRPELYFSDGQIKDEVYVFGSFLQSKMFEKGVRCSNCHDPHSGALVAEGNLVCTQCHNSEGNPDFPTLTKKTYDTTSHHHHEADSTGAQCVNCHMPSRTYMQVDPRRDHSFKIPRPDLSVELGTPDACTSCHEDKKPEWAAQTLKSWFPEQSTVRPDSAELFHLAQRQTSKEIADRLINLATNKQSPAIQRATALQLLKPMMTPSLVDRIIPFITDQDALVRRQALSLLTSFPRNVKVANAADALLDPSRSVRLEAARVLFDIPNKLLPEKDREAAKNAIRDYQGSLSAMADFPATQLNLSGLALVLRNLPAAEKALKTAVTMDPQLTRAWSLLARIQIQTRKLQDASRTLEEAISKAGPTAELYQILAGVRASLQDQNGAADAYQKALKLEPGNTRIYTELAALYFRNRRYGESIDVLKDLLKISPDNILGMEFLALNYADTNQLVLARDMVRKILKINPNHRVHRRLAPLTRLP